MRYQDKALIFAPTDLSRWSASPYAPLSRHVYANQLSTAESTKSRILVPGNDGSRLDCEAGVVFLPVEHEGNQQDSVEEIDAIVAAVDVLTGRELMLKGGGHTSDNSG